MVRVKHEGECFICHQVYAKAVMSQHVQSCLEKHGVAKTQDQKAILGDQIFLVEIVGYKQFWMYVEMPEYAELKNLDDFLREVWLECCSHLSEFQVAGRRYLSNTDEDNDGGDESMDIEIQTVLAEGTEFEYCYDFGTSTNLSGKVVSIRQGKMKKRIQLLARNHLPELACQQGKCAHPATIMCAYCGQGTCKACGKKHTCGTEGFLPYVNSPRAGNCGYCGSDVNMAKYAPALLL